jgi:hypothetical protein
LLGATEEMGMGMDETQMILALRALRELLDNGDRGRTTRFVSGAGQGDCQK